MSNRRKTIMITALREMCAGKKITALDYAKRYDTTRLGARIFDLRKLAQEHDRLLFIRSERRKDKYGETYCAYYISYLFREEGRKLLKKLEK